MQICPLILWPETTKFLAIFPNAAQRPIWANHPCTKKCNNKRSLSPKQIQIGHELFQKKMNDSFKWTLKLELPSIGVSLHRKQKFLPKKPQKNWIFAMKMDPNWALKGQTLAFFLRLKLGHLTECSVCGSKGPVIGPLLRPFLGPNWAFLYFWFQQPNFSHNGLFMVQIGLFGWMFVPWLKRPS